MAEVIQLLPESIANQIAAGEVIQRPASVVKELMENSIDAGSSNIELILKDSGKTLIQIVDDGKGMTEIDARMCFERHATSKIKTTADLFKINTMGFRGEALASIASIAHVDLKTRNAEMEMATHVKINGSKLEFQEPCQHPVGCSISVKNLFFNVPARRKFLKADATELRHILEEFKRIALIHPEVGFKVYHDGNELYVLNKGNFRQRIVAILGKKVNEQLIPVQEETEDFSIQGFVGKMDAAKKSRAEQYLYVNQRFIKSNYIGHAIKMAYGELLQKDHYPFYVINLNIDPAKIDINVHPTKHEIKFDEERLVYNFVNVTVKHGLGRYNLTPMIDFDNAPIGHSSQTQGINQQNFSGPKSNSKAEIKQWSDFYQSINESAPDDQAQQISLGSSVNQDSSDGFQESLESVHKPIQIHQTYILNHIKSGFILIDQKSAHERILYERFLAQLENKSGASQKLLFPLTFKYPAEKHLLIVELRDKLNTLGFEIEDFGHHSIIIHGIPTGMEEQSVQEIIDGFVDAYQANLEYKMGINENLAKSLAMYGSMKRGKHLSLEEMKNLIDQLFACEAPHVSPSGNKCVLSFTLDEIQNMFVV